MEPSIDLLSIVLLIGAAQGGFLVFALFSVPGDNRVANRYLALFLLLFSITLIDEFMTQTRYYLLYPHLLALIWPTNFLYAPLAYFYVRALTSQDPFVLGKQEWLHFIPFAIDVLYNIPNYLLSAEEKVVRLFRSEDVAIDSLYYLDLDTFGPLIQMSIYLLLSLRLISVHRQNIKDNFSYEEHINLAWLRNLLVALFFLWCLYVFTEIVSPWLGMVFEAWYLLHVMIVIVIYAMGYLGLRQPAIFSRLESTTGKNASQGDIELQESLVKVQPPVEKYKKSALTTEQSERILSRLQQMMESDKPYLDGSLNLPQLARELHVLPNYLSQAINEGLQKNFFDYVNQFRVEEAKRLLTVPTDRRPNILTIALDVGFNSKSAFYTAFKKHTEMTPSEFRKLKTARPA